MPIELILEARDEGPGADIDADVVAGAALERRAVDRAGEVDDDAIALFDLAAPSPLGANGRFCSAILSSASLDLRVGHLRHRRSSLMPLKSASSIFGSTSSASV